jgi:hypothetical protein
VLSLAEGDPMEKAYWLGRKSASLKMAQGATGSESRLIHYDLAGRYGLKAASAENQATDLASSLPGAIDLRVVDFSTNEHHDA